MTQAIAEAEYAGISTNSTDQAHARSTWNWDAGGVQTCVRPAPEISILVIDTDATLIQTVRAVGSEFNAHVFSTEDPGEGIDLFRAQLPDLVIADLALSATRQIDLLMGLLEIDSSAN